MAKAVRLDKFLADAGKGTRSEVKKFIQKGQVQVNGAPAKKPELKVDPEKDTVILSGETVGVAPEFVYYLLNKPAGCVSATEDRNDRTVMEYVPSDRKGIFPVGRLDKDSEIYQNIYVSVYTDKGEAVNAYGLKTEKLPDFVKEKITEMGLIQSSMQMDAPVTKEETVYTDDSEDMVSQEIIGGADEPTSIYLESSGDSGSSETE